MATGQSKDKSLFLIHYRDPKDGQTVSLKARQVSDSSLGLSFIKISDFVFESNGMVIKPSEEQLRKRLENVKSLHLAIYSVIAIEELSSKDLRFMKDKTNVVVFPPPKGPS